jgi:hypothetical protein
MKLYQRLFRWFKSLFIQKQKTVLVINPSPVFDKSKFTKPVEKKPILKITPKEFVKPGDPYFRFGSSYLSRLKTL